jgi:HK97 family phage major capsid protein
MKFKTIADAFNHYRTHSIAQIESRTAEIKGIIETDPAADIMSLNIEISGLQQAKENAASKQQSQKEQEPPPEEGQRSQFNPITGMGFTSSGLSREAAEGDVFASTEYRSAFFKHLLGRGMTEGETAAYKRASETVQAERRADAFNTTTNSPAVLPTATLNEVVKKARTMGGLLSVCRSFNMPSKLAVPVGTPSSRAQWHTEGAAVATEDVKAVTVTFDGYEIIKIFSISAAAKKMSIAAFESYLVDELTACVMECIADGLVNGTGAAQGTGILTIAWDASNSVTFAAAGLKYADVVKTVALLKRGYSAGAKWAMNNATLYNRFYGLVDATDRPIFIADPKQESIGKILGFEVVVDDNLADDVILFGNFQYMGYNIPEGIVIEVSRDSSFKSGLIDYRALAIADTKPIVPEAFVKLSVTE